MPLALILSQYFFGILMFLISLFLILLVLVQRGRGGGLTGALGGPGGQSAFGTKAGDVFTKITIVTAAIWIFTCGLAVWWMQAGALPLGNVDTDASSVGAGSSTETKAEGGTDGGPSSGSTNAGGIGAAPSSLLPTLAPEKEGTASESPAPANSNAPAPPSSNAPVPPNPAAPAAAPPAGSPDASPSRSDALPGSSAPAPSTPTQPEGSNPAKKESDVGAPGVKPPPVEAPAAEPGTTTPSPATDK